MHRRQASIKRVTKETRLAIKLKLDGQGDASIRTGLPFFDHMLTLFARHAVLDLKLVCQGDLEVDAHHTVEDCGIALGQAFTQALGDKRGIRRYGWAKESGVQSLESRVGDSQTGGGPDSGRRTRDTRPRTQHSGLGTRDSGFSPGAGEAYVPMDECLARCVIDFGGRPYLVWRGLSDLAYRKLSRAERRQDMSSAFRFGLAREFFQGFANEARCNLHLELLYGDEPHHVVEALFKAFAKAVDLACQPDPRIAGRLPSTKGKL
jgi:imidazoleglycerol-phosphate dehydratase